MEDIQKICDTIEERILKLHCTDWLYRIGDEAGELDDMWKISACIMCQILRSGKTEVDCKKRDTLIENVKSKLQFHKPAEKCNICGEVINFSSAKQDSCGNGHKFARCCQSLLLVQETPYRKCQNCRALAIALPDTAPECIKKMLVSTCTFCAGVVV
ncbi:general transcription factor 3C polypeptide 4-like [Lingula anatina]|uniref:General transcription factor 3C polypeptide 4-like n=1 Tax=Lingula anatina TaxID=7574 RepID=A0A1S3I0Z5_LINAN|nr:general transcription factor 3C polypeptide 4-like [Lingula anatina]|eukprot:XP_013391935.1 general transcription factor 3C polypeptide 4-like [Lingula anatina]